MSHDPRQDALVSGDFTEPRTDDLNAPVEWRGLPAFVPVTRDVRLVLTFDDEAGREELIEQLGLVIAKKTGKTWSAWWPPRDRDDLSALRFDFGDDGSASLPDVDEDDGWRPAPDEEVPAWGDHVGHSVALTYGHDGALIGARCSTCAVDLPPPDAVTTQLSPAPEDEDVVSDADAVNGAQDQQAAEDGADPGTLLERGPSAYDPFEF